MIRRRAEPPVVEQTDAERLAALEAEVRILRGRRETEEAEAAARNALTLAGPNGHRQPSAYQRQLADADAALVAARNAALEAAVAETERRRDADAGPRGRLEEQLADLDAKLSEAQAHVTAAQARLDELERERQDVRRRLGEREASYRVEPEPTPTDAAALAALRGEHALADDGTDGNGILRATIRRVLP